MCAVINTHAGTHMALRICPACARRSDQGGDAVTQRSSAPAATSAEAHVMTPCRPTRAMSVGIRKLTAAGGSEERCERREVAHNRFGSGWVVSLSAMESS